MLIELKPETARLVEEEIRCGHFQSIDELVVEAVRAFREKISQRSGLTDQQHLAEAVDHLRQLRKGVTLGGLKVKDLSHEGHRF